MGAQEWPNRIGHNRILSFPDPTSGFHGLFLGGGLSCDALHSALKEFLQVARLVLKEGDAVLVGFYSVVNGYVYTCVAREHMHGGE